MAGWRYGCMCMGIGTKSKFAALINLSLPLLFKAEPIVKKVPSRFSLFFQGMVLMMQHYQSHDS